MYIDELLRIDKLAAISYFVPDYKNNSEFSSIIAEIESVASRPIPVWGAKRCILMDLPETYPCYSTPSLENADTSPVIKIEDEDASMERVLKELMDLKEESLRSLGLSDATVRFILNMKVKPSRLRITRNSRIILDDYDGLEIRLDNKTKALYFLFLRHPEGIAIKDLPNHINELMDLYQSISGRDDPAAMRRTIENLADPFQNNANISLSRIKKAFCEAFTQAIACKYYVDGERGGLRSISLNPELVIWETIR